MSIRIGTNKNFALELWSAVIIWIMIVQHIAPKYLYTCGALGIIAGFVLFIHCIGRYGLKKHFFYFIVALSFFGILNNTLIGQSNLANVLTTLFVFFPVAIVFSHIERFSVNFWKWNIIFLYIFILYRYLLVNPGRVFYNQSENYFSFYLTFFLFLLTLVLDKEGKRIPFGIVIAYFVSCVIGLGRGGILAGAFYLMAQYCQRFINNRRVVFVGILLLAIFMALFIKNIDYILERYFTKFMIGNNSLVDVTNSRQEIVNEYLNVLTGVSALKHIMFGVNTNNLYTTYTLSGNVHNSFLMLHAYFGLGALYIIWQSIKDVLRKRFDLAIICITFFIRAVSDTFFLNEVGMIIPLYLMADFWKRDAPIRIADKVAEDVPDVGQRCK